MNLEIGLSKMKTRPLEEVLRVRDGLLFKRREFKFLLPESLVEQVLQDLSEEFEVSHSDRGFLRTYKTTYYDTPDLASFKAHRQGKYNRQKWRMRDYEDQKILECKIKVKGRFTEKKRWELTWTPLPKNHQEQVEISYKRLFLISKKDQRRITIDIDLRARCLQNRKEVDLLPGHAILEIKSRHNPHDLLRFFRQKYGLQAQSLSKYCLAICKLRDVKGNRWKQLLKPIP